MNTIALVTIALLSGELKVVRVNASRDAVAHELVLEDYPEATVVNTCYRDDTSMTPRIDSREHYEG